MPKVKLTDKQKKKIIADYAINQNYCETARINNISETTVRRIVKNDDNKEISNLVEQKKQENTKDILDYMDSVADKQKEIINLSMEALIKKLKKPDAFTTVKDIVTVYGIVFDKAVKAEEIKQKQTNNSNGKKVVIVNDLPRE